MFKAKAYGQEKIVYGNQIEEQYDGFPGTWLVEKTKYGYTATRIIPESIEEVKKEWP